MEFRRVLFRFDDNLRVIIYLIKKKGQWFCPPHGGTLVFNPQEQGHLNAVNEKMEENKKKMRKLQKPYKVLQMSGVTTMAVTAVGGAQTSFKGLYFPPYQKKQDE